MPHRPRRKAVARKAIDPRVVLPLVALILLAAILLLDRPAWLTLKPATGTATAMAAAADLPDRR